MNTIFSVRFLCIVGFMLLICPFYDSCNGHGMRRVEEEAVEAPAMQIAKETSLLPTNKSENNPRTEIEKPFIESSPSFARIIYESIDDENSQNAFEFAKIFFVIFESSFQEFKYSAAEGIEKNNFAGLFFMLQNLSFLMIIVFTFLNIFLSFTNRIKLLTKFSITILILLLIAIFCIVVSGFFEDLSQFKWGFYCFFVLNILIYIMSKKFVKQRMP